VNAVAPNPSTNAEFSRTLGKVLGRPARLRVPAFALRALPGGMGKEMLLASQRVVPAVLTASGFVFRHSQLEPALRDVLEW
jgi:NAD dependent epimerase/dehydratase family enzyme